MSNTIPIGAIVTLITDTDWWEAGDTAVIIYVDKFECLRGEFEDGEAWWFNLEDVSPDWKTPHPFQLSLF